MTSYSYQIELSSVAVSGSDIVTSYFESLELITGEFLLNAENQQTSLLFLSTLEATYDANAQYALTGSDVNFAVTFKTLAVTEGFALQGSPLTLSGSYEMLATPSTFVVSETGLNVSKIYLLTAAADNSSAFALTGADLTGTQGRALQVITGAFLLTGRDTTLRITNGRLVATRGFAGLTGNNLVSQYLASTALPALRPSKREFVPPAYSINTSKSMNGLTYRRMFASLPSGAELRLTYENLPEVDANTLLALYDTALGTYRSLTLPPETMAGAEPELQAYLNLNGTDQKWAFADPPTLESVAPGVHTVTLALRSRIVPPSSRIQLELCGPGSDCGGEGSGEGGGFGSGYGGVYGSDDSSLENIWFPLNTPPEPPPPEAPLALPGNKTIGISPGQTLNYEYDPTTDGGTTIEGAPKAQILIRSSAGTGATSGNVLFYRTYTTKIAYFSDFEASVFGSTGSSGTFQQWGILPIVNPVSPSATLTFEAVDPYGVITRGTGQLNDNTNNIAQHVLPGLLGIYPGSYYTSLIIDIVWP